MDVKKKKKIESQGTRTERKLNCRQLRVYLCGVRVARRQKKLRERRMAEGTNVLQRLKGHPLQRYSVITIYTYGANAQG